MARSRYHFAESAALPPASRFGLAIQGARAIQGVSKFKGSEYLKFATEFKGSEYLKFATVVQGISVRGISSTLTP
jgi:hypothetical protein